MKKVFVISFLMFSLFIQAQNKYISKSGLLTFEASVPSFEEVKGINKSTTAILNVETGDFAALVLVRGFRFKNALMEEHFNENYAESSIYPKATFKGQLTGFSLDSLTNGKTVVFLVNGTLNFHGISKVIKEISVEVTNNGDAINLKGRFTVLISDFGIEIPKIVSSKLSNEVMVTFDFKLNKK